jgi:hypothetical protein
MTIISGVASIEPRATLRLAYNDPADEVLRSDEGEAMTTVPDDEVTKLVSYLKYQAEKEPEAIREFVQGSHDSLLGILDGITEEQAAFKPSADVWSVLEVLDHVVTAKREVCRLCTGLASGKTYDGVGPEEERATVQDGLSRVHFESLDDARSAAETEHAGLLAFIDGISPETNVEARYKHFIFGALNCREWAAFQRVHDLDHRNQIEQVKAAPGYPN